jgi:hypothetical protein
MRAEAEAGGKGYDVGAAQSMGANAGDYMAKAQQAAQAGASAQAQQAATQGTQAALRASRSSGLNPGQAALASGQQAAGTYQQALGQGTQQGIQNYMGATGQFAGQGAEFAGRAQAGLQGQLGAVGQQVGAAGAQASAAGAQSGAAGAQSQAAGVQAGIGQGQQAQASQTAQNTWGTIGNLAGGAAMLLSDERAKTNIDDILAKLNGGPKTSPLDEILKKIDPVRFDYKGEPAGTEHLGTLAQQVEDSPLKNAVKETPEGVKMLDTNELSASYLPLIIELASRVKELEKGKV